MQPFPGMLRTWMSPAFARTAWRAIESPRPRPERSEPRRSPEGLKQIAFVLWNAAAFVLHLDEQTARVACARQTTSPLRACT